MSETVKAPKRAPRKAAAKAKAKPKRKRTKTVSTPSQARAQELSALPLEQLIEQAPKNRAAYALAYDQGGSQAGAYAKAYGIPPSTPGIAGRAHVVHWDPRVQAILIALARDRVQEHQDAQDRIIRRLRTIVSTGLDAVVDYDGQSVKVKRFEDLSPEALASLKKVKVKQRVLGGKDERRVIEEIEVEQHDPKGAAETLMRLLGLDKVKVEHSGTVTIPRLEELSLQQLERLLGRS